MTLQDLEELVDNNNREIRKLDKTSGSLIKAWLYGIASIGHIYIRLSDAIEGGNKVSYTHIEGDLEFAINIGRMAGLTVGDTTLEARNA